MANQLPAYLLNRKTRNLAEQAVQGLGGSRPPSLSIKDNRFTLIDAAGNEKQLKTLEVDVVIVDVNPAVSKIYYEGAYDPKATEYKSPDCYSDNGKAPSAQAPKPQHGVCMTCPHNEWGSKINIQSGKKTKACNDAKKIAVLVPAFDGGKIVFQLRVPAASLKNFKQYCQLVGSGTVGDRRIDLSDIVTTVGFESQGVLEFNASGYIEEETANRLAALDDSEETAMLVGRNDLPFQGQLAAPAKKEEPKQVAKPVQDEEPVARGRGRPKKEEAAPKPAAKLAVVETEDEADDIPAFLRPRGTKVEETKPEIQNDSKLQNALSDAFPNLDAAFNLPT